MAALLAGPLWAAGAEAQHLDREVEATLKSLYETTPAARELARTAKGVLVFHALEKRTQRTPPLEIELAKKRLKELLDV